MLFILSERSPETFPQDLADLVISPREYITRPALFASRSTRILNLAGDWSYLGMGYYASLLAEARGHTVLPGVEAIVSLNRKPVRQVMVRGLNDSLRARMAALGDGVETAAFDLFIAFGATPDARFARFARQVWEAFHFPLLRVVVAPCPRSGWRVKDIVPLAAKGLDPAQESFFQTQLARTLKGEWKPPKAPKAPRWSLAVLYDDADPLPPSNSGFLRKLTRAGLRHSVDVRIIGRKDLARLAEYDALFIRETTNVNHHTFTFARKAAAEGMPVIDDPLSILRCTNKVYLAELLRAHAIPMPETRVLDRRRLPLVDRSLAYPIVLKVPDGSFSRGVVKVDDRTSLLEVGRRLLASSDLILAQEFLPTEYDWRVGVLEGQPLFVCQYLMSRHHWQIVNHRADGTAEQGRFRTLDIAEAPAEVIALALRAAHLMGDGLYGVDIKQTEEKGCVVIEVNDNPNIDAGVEDRCMKNALYDALLETFVRRLEGGGPNRG